jgi:hypothetical protein
MDARMELQRLCETRWKRLADASTGDEAEYVDCFLNLLGWKESSRAAMEVAGQQRTEAYALLHDESIKLAAYFVAPGALEPPSNVVKKKLDFCETTRMLTKHAAANKAPYAFVTDLFRFYLYDTSGESLLLYADTPAAIQDDLTEVLPREAVCEGSLDDIRRQPRSYVARQLREWTARWCETLTMDWRASEETAWHAIDRLIVLRYVCEEIDLRRGEWSLTSSLRGLFQQARSATPEGVGRGFTVLCEKLGREWGADIFNREGQLDAILEQDAIAILLLQEAQLLSRTKFDIPTILESFNYGDASEKARVRMIPEDNEERRMYLAKQTVETIDQAQITLDLADEGYRSIFHWFDQLADLYERMGSEYEALQATDQQPEADMDLFGWSERDATTPSAVADRYRHLIEQGLVLYCVSPRQTRTARLMLYMHLISHAKAHMTPLRRFPDVATCLQNRPTLTESDYRTIYNPPTASEWDVV